MNWSILEGRWISMKGAIRNILQLCVILKAKCLNLRLTIQILS